MRKLMLLITVVGLISCGDGAKETVKTVNPPKIELPDVPPMLKDRELTNWMAVHFWDKMNPKDTAFKVYPADLAQVTQAWASVMREASFGASRQGIHFLFERAKDDSTAVSNLMFALEKAFYDPTLEIRNFEAYLSTLEWIVKYDKFSEADLMRPKAQLEMLYKNRVNTKANDFNFMTLDGKKFKLYDVYGPYTLIFLNNPGCPACQEYKDILSQNEVINNMVNCHALQIIGIIADDEEVKWREKGDDFPKTWVNGFNYDQKVRNERTYDLTVVPSLILLDKDKNVLLKDVNPNMLLDYLMRL